MAIRPKGAICHKRIFFVIRARAGYKFTAIYTHIIVISEFIVTKPAPTLINMNGLNMQSKVFVYCLLSTLCYLLSFA